MKRTMIPNILFSNCVIKNYEGFSGCYIHCYYHNIDKVLAIDDDYVHFHFKNIDKDIMYGYHNGKYITDINNQINIIEEEDDNEDENYEDDNTNNTNNIKEPLKYVF